MSRPIPIVEDDQPKVCLMRFPSRFVDQVRRHVPA